GDWQDLDDTQQRLVANPAGEGQVAADGGRLRADVAAWRERFLQQLPHCPPEVVEYARVAVSELNNAGARISPRRARLLARSLLAASVVEGRVAQAVFLLVLRCSLPQVAWGERVKAAHVQAAHRLAWGVAAASGQERWLHGFHLARSLRQKLELLAEHCAQPDLGTLAVEQLLGQESPERAAAFAFVAYPAALGGVLTIGAEALADLGKRALPLLHVEGDLRWREPSHLPPSQHAELAALVQIVDGLAADPPRAARARQFFYWALLNGVVLRQPAALEEELDSAVRYLAGRMPA
ncbi:MAG: hypothetical protein ACKO4A_03620, partial [Gammaproteobacteria bacterium]